MGLAAVFPSVDVSYMYMYICIPLAGLMMSLGVCVSPKLLTSSFVCSLPVRVLSVEQSQARYYVRFVSLLRYSGSIYFACMPLPGRCFANVAALGRSCTI